MRHIVMERSKIEDATGYFLVSRGGGISVDLFLHAYGQSRRICSLGDEGMKLVCNAVPIVGCIPGGMNGELAVYDSRGRHLNASGSA